ncbi:MAG TPA: hypothetical protein VGC41_25065 [Kofleriaceae bacterium]
MQRHDQANLDSAQLDLRQHISELKHAIREKLALPRWILGGIVFTRQHAKAFGVAGLFLFGFALGRRFARG